MKFVHVLLDSIIYDGVRLFLLVFRLGSLCVFCFSELDIAFYTRDNAVLWYSETPTTPVRFMSELY